MEELKQQLMEKIGLDADKSSSAIQIVVNFIKDKLPENLQGMVDKAIGGGGDDDGEGGGALDKVKGLLGGD